MAELADAAHLAAEHAGELTVQEYITHHLSFLTLGRTHDGHWGFAHTPEEAARGSWLQNFARPFFVTGGRKTGEMSQ